MKFHSAAAFILVAAIALTRCGQKSQKHDMHHDHEAPAVGDKTKELYDQVMGVHNEVMPKMDEIYKIKEALKNQIAETSSMPEPKKKEIEHVIFELDSASESMMDWMHKFSPLPDSTGEDAAREYLDQEMVKITKVKEAMLSAIDKGNALKK